MKHLYGEKIYLRALEPKDIDILLTIENDPSIWHLSDTTAPFSRFSLQNYLEKVTNDIFLEKQLRMVVVLQESDQVVGFVDLYDFDSKNRRVGLGLVVYPETMRVRGIGKEAVHLLGNYCFEILQLHQVYATILEDNLPSIRLFESLGYVRTGCRKDWVFWGGVYKNEWVYQKMNTCI
ncbi:MAG: GNAT family N-acetyltransferase [Flavobacteriaceae bacterium]|nr:GNAT family N-acetyltransferase [Flavobacteriaceae bacterium]